MGNWGCYLYSDGTWTERPGPSTTPEAEGIRTLQVLVAASDFAEVRYWPVTAPANGSAFVGFSPRSYFDDPSALGCRDARPEAVGLAAWAGNGVQADQLAQLLATDDGESQDTFVEETVDRLVVLLGLPPVAW